MDEQTLRKILKEELKGFARKDDLANFATKDDIKSLRQEIKDSATAITEDLTKLMNNFVQAISDKKADKDLVMSHEVRINDLERKVFPQ